MAFATSNDLEVRWRTLTDAEAERADVLLGDAAVYLSALVGIDPEDENQQEALKIVSCNMVQRAMVASANNAFGVSEARIQADIYSQTMTYANPSGDLYLTAAEKRLLGITGSYLTSIRPTIDPVEVRMHDRW